MTPSRRLCAKVLRHPEDRCGCLRLLRGSVAHLFGMDTKHIAADHPWRLEPLLDTNDLAEYLRVPVSTARDRRTHGLGPLADRFCSI